MERPGGIGQTFRTLNYFLLFFMKVVKILNYSAFVFDGKTYARESQQIFYRLFLSCGHKAIEIEKPNELKGYKCLECFNDE